MLLVITLFTSRLKLWSNLTDFCRMIWKPSWRRLETTWLSSTSLPPGAALARWLLLRLMYDLRTIYLVDGASAGDELFYLGIKLFSLLLLFIYTFGFAKLGILRACWRLSDVIGLGIAWNIWCDWISRWVIRGE